MKFEPFEPHTSEEIPQKKLIKKYKENKYNLKRKFSIIFNI